MKLQPRVRLGAVRTLTARVAFSIALILGIAPLAQAQPNITRQPTDQFVDAGKSVNLSFLASSATPYTNQWFFNGVALAEATNNILRFTNAQPSLHGDYFAVLGNDSGSVTSQVARLTVFVPTPHSIDSLQLQPDGSVALGLAGETTAALGRYYDLYPLQVSSNLVDWTPLTTLQRTNAAFTPLTFLDTNAAGFNQRFYATPTNLLVTPLPPPTGPYPVGTFSRLLTDPARANGTKAYQFMVTVWYPAAAGAGMVPVSYVDKQVAASSYYYGAFTTVVPVFRSHSVTNVALATNEVAYPVLLYSPGAAHHRRENTDRAEDLASWGYVVVGLDTQDTSLSVFPNGTIKSGTWSGFWTAIDSRVRDEQFVMDELARWNISDPLLTGRLDLDRIGAFGWSLGGATAAELCLLDRRCKAGAGFDGSFFKTNVLSQAFSTPFLFFRANSGLDPEPFGWIGPGQPDDRLAFFHHSATNAYWVKLSGTDHSSFAEQLLVSDPTSFENKFGTPVDGQLAPGYQVCQIVRAYLLAFFNKHLRGQDNHLLDGPSPSYPGVMQFLSKPGVSGPPEYPSAGLAQGSDGSLYGTSAYGGDSGVGTVFRVTPAGELTTLVSFNGANGSHPVAALLPASDGNFYGTTANGGANGDNGTVFQITPAGALTTLVSLNGTNGSHPYAGLLQGSDGHFYGTTETGGTNGNNGTVFQITPVGALTTLVSFKYGVNGTFPFGALVQDTNGDFYGTTSAGSAGTVFKVTPAGQLTTLVVFSGAIGSNPSAGLVRGADGNFYGTTLSGGNMSLNAGTGFGTVFKMTPAGGLTTRVVFNGANGSYCTGQLLEGSDGNFYGTTAGGGAGGSGTVFKMTPDGGLTTLVSFNGANGRAPQAPLVQGSDGNFYGTTQYGGPGGAGTVFQMTPAGVLKMLVAFGGRANFP